MASESGDAGWRALTEDVLTGMREWRSAHPKASFAELEAAVEERLGRLRVRMLEDAALRGAGKAEAEAEAEAEARTTSGVLGEARCPDCGAGADRLVGRGRKPRTITVTGNQSVRLERGYGVCSTCGVGLFPPG